MNTRSGLLTFLLFMLLLAMILLQVLAMVQSDRLYERLNVLLDTIAGRQITTTQTDTTTTSDDQYPGDEGDWLIWCFNAEPANLNPLTRRDAYASYILEPYIFEAPLKYNYDTLELELALAKSYKVSDDGLELSFILRDDTHFSDGKPITVDDIIFTYETIINPGVDAASLANYYQDIDRVVKISDREVKFIMKRPYFKSLEFTGGITILPRHIYQFDDPDKFNKHISNPVGSGPYVFEKWDVGKEIVLRRNENYWGPKPKLKKIVFRFITNDVAAVQALRSHQIDFLLVTSEQYTDLIDDKNIKEEFKDLLYWDPTRGYNYIGWNQDKPFFKDRRVRLAMTCLIDRESINKNLLKGLGKIVTGPFYILGPQSNPDTKPWPYDPKKAAQLLDEAGWIDTNGDGIRDKDGIPFRFKFMLTSGGGIIEQLARLLKDEAAKVGIDVIVDEYEWSVFGERLNTRSFDAVALGWGGVVESDPYQIWHSSQIEGRGSNRIGFANPQADTLIEEARKTLDKDKRNKIYHEFHQILHEEQPYTFLFTSPWKYFLDGRFENVKIHNLGFNTLEWYVPKEKQRYK
ncbi:MAG: peptide-binding protein [Sedimentisphaerales bacterium]|nr:peptide-binding protein [Sedimentisphaerales bacterium]